MADQLSTGSESGRHNVSITVKWFKKGVEGVMKNINRDTNVKESLRNNLLSLLPLAPNFQLILGGEIVGDDGTPGTLELKDEEEVLF